MKERKDLAKGVLTAHAGHVTAIIVREMLGVERGILYDPISDCHVYG